MNTKTLNFAVFAVLAALVLVMSAPALAQTPIFPDFSNTTGLSINGNAVANPVGTPGVLRLTPAIGGQAGSTFFVTKQQVAAGFTTIFKFQMTNPSAPPADGIAFVIHNDTTITATAPFGGAGALAGTGGAIGYSDGVAVFGDGLTSGIPNSLAVEFDTFLNAPGPNNDPNPNHVGIQSCGSVQGNSADHNATFPFGEGTRSCNFGLQPILPVTLSDGNVHTVRIDYDVPATCPIEGPCGSLQVTLDGTALFPGGVGISLSSQLVLDQGTAWVGFTGATGADFENQDILSWTFTSHSPTTSQTQTINPGVTTTYNFGTYDYEITPRAGSNTGGDQLTIEAVLVDPGNLNDGTPKFDPGPNFPGATCFVYDGTGGHCVEFHAVCVSGTDCAPGAQPLYDLATTFNKALPPITPVGPGLLTAPGQPCPPPAGNPFSRNIFSGFSPDPIIKGAGGPGYSCFVGVQNVSYPNANLALLNVASSKVQKGKNLTYFMALINLGPGQANAVNVADTLPAGTSFVSASVAQTTCTLSSSGVACTPPPQGRPCLFDGTTVNCNVGLLTPFSFHNLTGAIIQLTVNVNAPVGTKIKDTATATEVNADPFPGNNSSTATTTVVTPSN